MTLKVNNTYKSLMKMHRILRKIAKVNNEILLINRYYFDQVSVKVNFTLRKHKYLMVIVDGRREVVIRQLINGITHTQVCTLKQLYAMEFVK